MDSRHDVGLVVGHAARDDPPVLFRRLERWRVPEVDRVDRLDVVVLVQQELAAPGSGNLRIERGHAARLEGLDPVRVTREPVREPVARRLDCIPPVVGDAGKRTELLEVIDEAARVLLDVRVDSAR